MATFTRFTPAPNQTAVPRTAVVGFSVLVDSYGVQISTLSAKFNGTTIISAGAFVNGYMGNIAAGTDKYVVGVFPQSPYFAAASEITVELSVLDAYDTEDSYEYSFYTAGFVPPPPPPPEPSTGRACLAGKPFFLSNNVGLQAALDKGTGTEIELEWNQATPYDEDDFVCYNIYLAENRVDVDFDGYPSFLTTAQSVSLGGFAPGSANYFGVRATEVVPGVSTLNGLRQVGTDLYVYPSTTLSSDISEIDTTIPVVSVDGFPDFGILLIEEELIRYLSKQEFPPAFVTDVTGREYLGTVNLPHSAGCRVSLYKGNEDNNSVIAEAVPTFQKPNYAITWVKSDGYGPDGYRDGYDGYGGDAYFFPQQVKRDDITTDGTNNDASGTFPRFDYCGTYRRLAPADFWQGQCVGTYFGGVQKRDGQVIRGNNVRMHMLQREELMLETEGEPFVLMRRLWTGVRCTCFMLRREHPDARCPICLSTSFVGGYQQFINPRRPDGRILIRVDPATDDLKIGDKDSLTPEYTPANWTIAFPAIKDRDVLVRFNEDGTEEFRYEVLRVTRVKSFFGQSGVQRFDMQRFGRGDIIYQLSVTRDMSPHAVLMTTGASAASGIPAHVHTVNVPYGADLSKFNGTTAVNAGSDRHLHVVRNGVVQTVLGHTHTL